MYRIGEFSTLTGASVKTLRYYDEINLLKPSNVDKFTNYRYYTEDELQQFKRIEYLKRLGFTLEEIKINLPSITVECLDQKKEELKAKRDYIIAQMIELDAFRESLIKSNVKTLSRN